jgi:EpsD family peptidyl-prolyl cis-trans isomerase
MNGALTGMSAAAGLVLVATAIVACSNGNSAERPEVVARVNDAAITVSQLRTALRANGDDRPSAEAVQQTFDGLVNEQLLVDAALASQLDRDPIVVEAIEAARRQVLARAFVDRAVLPIQEVSAADQTTYYRENPALFAQRRIYQIAAFTVAAEALTPGVVKKLGPARSPDGVALVLTGQHIAFEMQNLTRSAEQLALEQLPQFAAASIGDVLIHPAPNQRTTLMLITGTQSAPLGFESAQPLIQRYLANMRNAEALEAHLKAARAAATISAPDPALLVAAAESERQPEPASVRPR